MGSAAIVRGFREDHAGIKTAIAQSKAEAESLQEQDLRQACQESAQAEGIGLADDTGTLQQAHEESLEDEQLRLAVAASEEEAALSHAIKESQQEDGLEKAIAESLKDAEPCSSSQILLSEDAEPSSSSQS
eukprot:gnl/MRDRNA2_/MRDRNA2_94153_c0_seq1.p1 gnl/MRDRNA2_/MRDRNA2_94153_c0~~gnl/MRDRNA2_/MRDRNA2_94153_c0_seq1.p1  ORF type:complete len:131 (+),score=41.72 gnl/MRDRNA2_/MRDRNA2_94153_c0_seq1:123-515(+)